MLDYAFGGTIIKMIFLGNYASNALGGLIAGPDCKATVETLLNQIGGTLEEMTFTRGEYDIIAVRALWNKHAGSHHRAKGKRSV